MIEATNSVLANAQFVRGVADQTSAARSFAANPDRAQEVPSGPSAPYISPYIFVDVNYDKAVLQIRDSDTGDVLRQFPSESALEARRKVDSVRREPVIKAPSEGKPQEIKLSGDVAFTASLSGSSDSSGVSTAGIGFTPSTNAGSGNAEAQVAAAALAASAQSGQVFKGAVTVTA